MPITSYTSRYVTVYIYIYPMYVYILCVWLTIQPSTFTVWYFIWYVFNFWSAFSVIWAHIACNIDIIPFTLAVIQHFELRLVYYDNFSYHTVTWSKSLQSSETSENQNLYHNQLVTLKSHHTWPWITSANEAVFFLSASSTASTGLNTAFPARPS